MKYQITYSCGHEDTLEAFGPKIDREKKLEWAKEYGLCPDCFEKEQERILFEFEMEHDLPNIKGTAKQTAWARRLRKEIFEKTLEYAEKHARTEVIENFIDWLKTRTDCRFWIDNGSMPVRHLFDIYLEERKKSAKIFDVQQTKEKDKNN